MECYPKYATMFLKWSCDLSTMQYSHHTMIYGAQIWGQTITTHTEKVFKLQNRAMRIIDFADFHADANPIYKTNSILKLEDHIKLQNCLFVYDFLKSTLPVCFNTYFTKINTIHTSNTINSELGCLFTPYMSTVRYGLQSITRQCINTWNFFSRHLKTDLSLLTRPVLKGKLNSYFINTY